MKKKDLPAMPFYWGDWFKAIDVQSLPRDIRCVWFEILGRMWENSPRGELSINGKPLTDEQLTILLGFGNDVKECKRCLKILDEFSVFSRKKNGVIYNRRMTHNEEISRKRSISGHLGGLVSSSKIQANGQAKIKQFTENENETERIDIYKDIIEHLNILLNTNYKLTNKNKELIKARLNDGFTKEDFFTVHSKKYAEWGSDDKMCRYLRPITLYSNKFESYLNQKEYKGRTLTDAQKRNLESFKRWKEGADEQENV